MFPIQITRWTAQLSFPKNKFFCKRLRTAGSFCPWSTSLVYSTSLAPTDHPWSQEKRKAAIRWWSELSAEQASVGLTRKLLQLEAKAANMKRLRSLTLRLQACTMLYAKFFSSNVRDMFFSLYVIKIDKYRVFFRKVPPRKVLNMESVPLRFW